MGIIILAVVIIAWNLTVAYVDTQLQENRDTELYSSCHKVWAPRGLYIDDWYDKNSIKSMQSAFSAGARGVEVDFYYDIKMNRFIVSHDKPLKGSDGTLHYTKKDGKLLTMEKLLQTVGEGHYFWLDYKNLDKLSDKETQAGIERLLSITQGSIRNRIYIEGSNPLRLSMYTDAGFKTILGIHPLRENNLFSSIVINGFKIIYYFTNISGIALPYGSKDDPVYGEETAKSLGAIPIFLFHVPDDKELLYTLVEKNSVRVILVGRDLSLNRFDINACK